MRTADKQEKSQTSRLDRWLSRIFKFFIVVGLLLLISSSFQFFADYYSKLRWSSDAATLWDMDTYFLEKDYVQLYKMVEKNEAMQAEMDDLTLEYVAFANCFDAAVEYYMYRETDHSEEAAKSLERFTEHYRKLTRVQFFEALQEIVTAYQLPETVLK